MTELILHHYWGSPYAEKVRLALGYKHAGWRSREITVTPPRPSLAPILGKLSFQNALDALTGRIMVCSF